MFSFKISRYSYLTFAFYCLSISPIPLCSKLFFYPLNDDYLLEPGKPSQKLVRGHKALGDELRLKLLYQLQQGPLSLQEMSTRFAISKTTLHHQLSILKSAKFVKVHKGIYSVNNSGIDSFSGQLQQFLGGK